MKFIATVLLLFLPATLIAGRGPKQVSDGIGRANNVESRIPCPMCAEQFLPEAKICPFCKSDLVK
jgi:hypothetical protein